MIKSMTAYGKSQEEGEYGKIIIELQSINRKYLDVNLNLPKELSGLDPEIREYLKNRIARGQVQLKVFFTAQSASFGKIVLNLPIVMQYKQMMETLADTLGINSKDVSALQFLLQQPQIFSIEMPEDSKLKNLLMTALDKAFRLFQNMKIEEGFALEKDLRQRLQKIKSFLDEISIITAKAPSKYQEKLIKRLQEVNATPDIIDQRVLVEVALFADKIDISEEITRFQSHIEQFYNFFLSTESVGKTLEFLLQEMFREANTMSVKIGDLKGVQLCLEIKGELEKMREQVQNIE